MRKPILELKYIAKNEFNILSTLFVFKANILLKEAKHSTCIYCIIIVLPELHGVFHLLGNYITEKSLYWRKSVSVPGSYYNL